MSMARVLRASTRWNCITKAPSFDPLKLLNCSGASTGALRKRVIASCRSSRFLPVTSSRRRSWFEPVNITRTEAFDLVIAERSADTTA
jgi:hypothetical protein